MMTIKSDMEERRVWWWDNLKCNATLSVQRNILYLQHSSSKFIWDSSDEADDDGDEEEDDISEIGGA